MKNPSLEELQAVPWYMWGILGVALLTQGISLFIDARKRGSYPWFWGIWGLIQFPTPTVIYLLAVRKVLHPFVRQWIQKRRAKK
ncbi:hypothetical protein [Paenibacillus daejeonensis]|uniref:hypothetical protein n=1 Tax=Paenibacillus daejeonensis TaxID=135193 RepID=UPI00036279FC|nr:hypothetical protein [Paenibacillus daejeonensis]